jgi:predicted negative regulator of RcsB-dependent stress response
MKRFLAVWTTMAILVMAYAACAEDEIYLRGKDKAIKGVVVKESAKGISLKAGGDFPAETIDDILYEVNPVTVRLQSYRPAFNAEKDFLDPAKQKEHKKKLDEALKGYQDAAAKVQEPFAKRHSEYKVAVLLARQAEFEGKAPDAAIDALKKYKSKNADSWQIVPCLQLLGRLQLDQRDFDGARETYGELVGANVPDDVKQEAQLLVIQVSIRAGKSAEAKSALDAFVKSLPEKSKYAVRARVIQAELQIAAKDYDGAMKMLTQAAKETADRELKAIIYNAKGVCLFEKQDYKAARWEFLWVDVAYNHSKAEHAKALYYLARCFDELNDQEKAQECRELLLGDRGFANSEWRARAQKETKSN